MDMPEVGDEVLVTLKGTVDRVLSNGFAIVGPQGNGQTVYTHPSDVFKSVEVLPPPEKEWVDGDVVRSASGSVFVRANGGWVAGWSTYFRHDDPVRPLTELTP